MRHVVDPVDILGRDGFQQVIFRPIVGNGCRVALLAAMITRGRRDSASEENTNIEIG